MQLFIRCNATLRNCKTNNQIVIKNRLFFLYPSSWLAKWQEVLISKSQCFSMIWFWIQIETFCLFSWHTLSVYWHILIINSLNAFDLKRQSLFTMLHVGTMTFISTFFQRPERVENIKQQKMDFRSILRRSLCLKYQTK